jgi:hypothetical protein
MDVFIYAQPGFGRARDELEDAINGVLGDRGEVVGSGAGASGANIDIEIFSDNEPIGPIVEGLRRVLAESCVPRSTMIVISDHEHPVYP